MSEFLKTVRNAQGRYSGKRHGNYDASGGYYSQDRRAGTERRGQSPRARGNERSYTRQEDLLTPIRQMLEQILESQRIQEGFVERQTIASEEVAAAFIDIAKVLERFTEGIPAAAPTAEAAPPASAVSLTQLTDDQLLSPADERREAIKIMKKLRKKGATYKEIAQFLNEKEIPTFSNKGHWHAQTIHRLCNQ